MNALIVASDFIRRVSVNAYPTDEITSNLGLIPRSLLRKIKFLNQIPRYLHRVSVINTLLNKLF